MLQGVGCCHQPQMGLPGMLGPRSFIPQICIYRDFGFGFEFDLLGGAFLNSLSWPFLLAFVFFLFANEENELYLWLMKNLQ